jgi:hypothetical protein
VVLVGLLEMKKSWDIMTENEREYRKALKYYLWLYVLCGPVVFPIGVALFKLFGSSVPFFVLGGLWQLAWLVAAGRATFFRYRWKTSKMTDQQVGRQS